MKKLVILGGGIGGTIVANRVRQRLSRDWSVQIVDPKVTHLYQPGLLFVPFGAGEGQLQRLRANTLGTGVEWICDAIIAVDAERRAVKLSSGKWLDYDLLVIATGSEMRPDLTPGMSGPAWQRDVFTFYRMGDAIALRQALERFEHGRLVVNAVELPVKGPSAPLDFLYLADDYFTRRGNRGQVELVYAAPIGEAATSERNIRFDRNFHCAEVDDERRVLRSRDDQLVPYDLLVTIPIHTGATFIGRTGLGDDRHYIPTDPRTLAALHLPNVFVIGDAANLPVPKAGAVALFQAEAVTRNLVLAASGLPLEPCFDIAAEPLAEAGQFPVVGVGPFSIFKKTHTNRMANHGFRRLYWNALLPSRDPLLATGI